MALRVNTNVTALEAHRNLVKNDTSLSRSLERLSSGLRINRAADDASGMTIADNLKAQALGLGQAIRNANDGIALVQVADGALDESINIVNIIKSKAIQAASDGQNNDSRAAIQRDINKLLEEMQNIATTTSFNGMKLLDGTFLNKSFQIGAYKGETIGISIVSVQTNNVGAYASVTGGDTTAALASGDLTLNGTDVGASSADSSTGANTTAHSAASAWAIAKAINSVASSTGVKATATNSYSDVAVVGGSLASGGLTINGINIGAVTVAANDENNALVNAINAVSNQTYVTATNEGGIIKLTAVDGSDIVVAGTDDGAVTGIGNTTKHGTVTLDSRNAITIAGAAVGSAGLSAGTVSVANAINSVDVRTQAGAAKAILQADYALANLDDVRSGLGSVQNQLESTVRNISVTRINISSAESAMRETDFAEESANFAKFQILAQSGTFAMAQSNSSMQNVMRLLQ